MISPDILISTSQSLASTWSAFHDLLILFIILGLLFALIKDRHAFIQPSKNILLLLSLLFVFLMTSYLILGVLAFIAGGHWSGKGSCGLEGCTYESNQPIMDVMGWIVALSTLPSIFIIIIGALYLLMTSILKLDTQRRTFEASYILLSGCLLLTFLIVGNYIIIYVSLIAYLLLSVISKYYKHLLYSVVILLAIYISI